MFFWANGIEFNDPTEYAENIFWTPEGNLINAKLVFKLILVITDFEPELKTYCTPFPGFNSTEFISLNLKLQN